MGNQYDDAKYGVINRQEFGLMKKLGGENPNSTGGFAQSSGIDTTFVSRWYPKGPIDIHKVGYKVQTTALGGASRTRLEFQFKTNNANDAVATIRPTSTTVAAYTLASTSSLTTAYCNAGSYITIIGATPHIADQATLSYNAVTGTVAFFIDWSPKFGSGWQD